MHVFKFNEPNNAAYCLGAIADSGGRWKGKGEIDEGLKLGDYPVLPWKSAQLNAPRGWWDNQDRRNKEDPVSEKQCGSTSLRMPRVDTRGRGCSQCMDV